MTPLGLFTLVHVVISLIGIGAGFVVMFGWVTGRRFDGYTALFLIFTVATSVTGFFFPVHHFMPSHGVGIISLLVLPIAIFARYREQMTGAWRWIFIVTAALGQYLNFFVLIVQSFMKVPALKSLAPTQTELPFKITQLIVLLGFFVFTVIAARRFRPTPSAAMAHNAV